MQHIITNLLSNAWVFLLLILFFTTQSAWFKGWLGECLVKLNARLYLDSAIYHGIHNVTLEYEDETTQIDHIFVSRYGIFVVETKNYKGWIFGNERQSTWTQVLFKKKFQFQNPLRQNFKHLKVMEAALGVSLSTLKPVIVFVGDSSFKTPMPSNVTYARGYTDYILSFKEPLITDEEVTQLVVMIQNKRLTHNLITNYKHIKDIRAKHKK